jgi:ketosteroid isomerase-like protein
MDLVERSYEAFHGLDPESIVPLYTDDVEWVLGPASLAFGTESFQRHNGLRALIAALASIFPDWTPSVQGIREREDGAMLVIFHAGGTAQRDDVELDVVGGQIIEFRDGLICRVTQTSSPPPGWDEATPVA